MRLISRPSIGHQIHRSGWPYVMSFFEAGTNGVLLDDCVEASFLFRPIGHAHREPWVGIFHFPSEIESPMPMDTSRNWAQSLWGKPLFRGSLPRLVGAVTLCEDLAVWLRRQIRAPVVKILHPTATDVPQWDPGSLAAPTILQVGYHIRNARAIFHVPPTEGWRYVRVPPVDPWQRRRDRKIRARLGRECNDRVTDLPGRLSDEEYDEAFANSVILTHVWGAAANNVVVECIARGTPLLINPLPAVVEYVGPKYPLYFHRLKDVPRLLTRDNLLAASAHLVERRGDWMRGDVFAAAVNRFVREVSPC